MFQFDSGTYADTVRRYGASILTVEGNATAVIPFLLNIILNNPKTAKSFGLSQIKTEADFILWMNQIVVQDGNPKYEAWLNMVSCFYNGSCNGQKVAVYRARTNSLKGLYGLKFFETTSLNIDPESCGKIRIVRTSGDWINLRSSFDNGSVVSKAKEGETFEVIGTSSNGKLVSDPSFPEFSSKLWYEVKLNESVRAWVSATFANCIQ